MVIGLEPEMEEGRAVPVDACAELPQFIEMDIETRIKYCKSPETKCWLPGKLSDKDLQHYIWAARSITALAGICNGGNLEKGLTVSSHDSASFNALEWLHFNKYDTSKALTGMVTNPLPSHVEGKWAEEEKRLFEQGIKQFGKHFDKIRREYLPKKNTNDLVEYYYLWKITPEAFHIRFQKKKGSKNNGHPFSKKSKMKSKEYSSDNGEVSSGSGTAYSDTEESNAEDEDLKNRDDIRCDHCKIDKSDTWRYGGVNKMVLCVNCRLHFKRFGDMPIIQGNGIEESSLSDTSQAKSSSPLTSGEDVKVKKEDETPMEESSEQNEEDTTLEIVEEEEEEEVEEEELEMIDEEDSEPPNEMINKTYGDSSVKFERPSCRGQDKCARTDMKFISKQEKTTPKKETPIAKTEPTPIKSEIDPLTTPRVDIGVQPFNFPSQSVVPKLEPSYHAKMLELYQQHEAAAKMQKLQQEGLYNMPQGLRPPLNMLQAFNMRAPASLINSVEAQQKLLQGLHPSVHPEQLMAIDAWARQQQQQVQQAQQREQQQPSNPLEHIQRVLEQAKTPAEHQKLREQIASFEASREAWARHLENPAQQPPTSQWQRFVETQALAAAQQRGFEIPNLIQQRQLLQQPPTTTPDRRKQRSYPFHQLFPVMARRHRDKKKQECRLKTDDDEVIYMGIGNQQPRTVAPQHIPHITNTAAKASFSPLNPQHRMSLPQGINTLPQGLSNIPGLGQLPGGLNNLQYANFLKVLSNPNMLRGHL